MAGWGPTFRESPGTFSPSGLQRWWRVKGGHRAPGGAGHGGSGVWSFGFESLFARAVHCGGGVYWSLHTLVWHLQEWVGLHSQHLDLHRSTPSYRCSSTVHLHCTIPTRIGMCRGAQALGWRYPGLRWWRWGQWWRRQRRGWRLGEVAGHRMYVQAALHRSGALGHRLVQGCEG